MATGHAYDSDGGRALAGAITSLMTGTSYKASAELAGVVGPYDGFERNKDAHTRVMRKHAAANDAIRTIHEIDKDVQKHATAAWEGVLKIGAKNGWRNAQASVLAPTGTIGFMMDCAPPASSRTSRWSSSRSWSAAARCRSSTRRCRGRCGSTATPRRRSRRSSSTSPSTVTWSTPRPEAGALRDLRHRDGWRPIKPMGHVRMMAAAQPFLSGAISKTVNLPETATVEEIADVYFQGWKLGLKALAVYRDNCKVGQPLADAKAKKTASAEAETEAASREDRREGDRVPADPQAPAEVAAVADHVVQRRRRRGLHDRRLLPGRRPGRGLPEDGQAGFDLAGVMDAFSIAISIALQHGVPLETYVQKFTNLKFEPAGLTDDPDVRMAQSIMDYIFRRLALDYLPFDERAALGIYSAEERSRQLDTGSYEPAPVEVSEAES